MIRVTKGDINILCDTQADLKIAMAALMDEDEPALPDIEALHIEALRAAGQYPADVVPGWRVGGPSAHNPVPHPYPVPEADEVTEGAPRLSVVDTEPDSDAPSGRMNVDMGFELHYIPVRAKQLDVLEAVLLFPEGVPVKGVAQLLGLTEKAVGQRMQSLKKDGLVELVPHHHLWRATTLARRAKLVRA